MKLNFYIRFSTKFGQTLLVSGSHTALGNSRLSDAVTMHYFNNEFWHAQVEIPETSFTALDIEYRYILREEDGNEIVEWGDDRIIECKKTNAEELTLIDTWNHAGDVENAFYTKAFRDILLKNNTPVTKVKESKTTTHVFKVKAPLLQPDEVLCVSGNGKVLNDWKTEAPVIMHKEGNWWTAKLNLAKEAFPIAYKYGVYNLKHKSFVRFENSDNRTLSTESAKGKLCILHDGFAQLGYPAWKGTGVAIPVFSLRSKNSFGCGEFTDIQLLVNWAKACGLKLIQLLPINDTTATHTNADSYPYAAISAFALHPLYLNLEKVAGIEHASIVKALKKKQQQLNELDYVDYEQVMQFKTSAIKELFELQKTTFQNDNQYTAYFEQNRHWLVPYAAFCYLRDKYNTADYNQWKSNSVYDEAAILRLSAPSQKHHDEIAIHYFTQYQLHLQLKDAAAYAHKNGIIVKGDLPIGIYRYGCDAWMAPELYNMDAQAGAPPDDFAIKGQNWGFPTYNWQKMQEDGFAWWRRRFEQMSEYFDAFRIDHILGFFRIWSIPLDAVEGILGKFVPAIPVHINELYQQHISYSHHRYCKPYISRNIISERFRNEADHVINTFLNESGNVYELKPEFDTQRKVEAWFNAQPENDTNGFIRLGLYDLISNIILIEEAGSQGQQFHFRINMESTTSFRDLDEHSKQKLKELYVNYFFRRQDDFWKKEAMHKLPELKRSTNMLVCGEDLGMVPDCVPDVMQQLGMLSLEIQRMPKQTTSAFFHPNDAPYLSVVTPSTHDMSTIRGWWQEDTGKTQDFYINMLGHYGKAPFYCEPYINKEIVIQHLYSPAMWSIFQLQDLLGSSEKLRRQRPEDERINIPADPKHFWKYRMHLSLEDLIKETAFNDELKSDITASGRL